MLFFFNYFFLKIFVGQNYLSDDTEVRLEYSCLQISLQMQPHAALSFCSRLNFLRSLRAAKCRAGIICHHAPREAKQKSAPSIFTLLLKWTPRERSNYTPLFNEILGSSGRQAGIQSAEPKHLDRPFC